MPSPIIPKALKPGATIAFISPSARLNLRLPTVISRAKALLSGKGYEVRIFFTPDSGLQSSITNRLSEIRSAFLDPTISAVICTIGGDSFTELLPALIADKELHAAIRTHPKIVVGFSDITGLHWFLNAVTGLRTFYGPTAIPELGTADPIDDEASPLAFNVRSLFNVISKPEPIGDIPRSPIYAPGLPAFFRDRESTAVQEVVPAPAWQWLRPGKGEGRLFGGCLTVVVRLNGIRAITPDWRGRVVFLETSCGDSDNLDEVQKAFADLIAQGVFEEAAGLVVGRPFGYDSEERREKYVGVIKKLLCEGALAEADNQFPILFNVDIGHTTPMVTLPFDALAVLDSESDRFAILEAGVA
jgi:muramoyltetrapeptide carboxypeptidase LdcA involved in peptidoglycan recycling